MSLAALQSELRTLDAVDARAAHARLGRMLCDVAGGDASVSFTIHAHNEVDYFAEMRVTGAPDIEAFSEGLEGRATHWLPWREDARGSEANRFVESVRYTPGPWRELWLWRDLYAPYGVNSKKRALVYDAGRFVHYVSVCTRDGRQLSDHGLKRLSALTDDVLAVTRAIDRLRPAAPDSLVAPCYAQFRGNGRCEFATPSAQRLLDAREPMRRELSTRVRAIDRHNDARGWSISGGSACEIVRMDGADGVRYLVVWHKLSRPHQSVASRLTRRQLEVADFAAAGATVEEIASAMSISPNTVKSHLKRVYETLDVGSRVELAEALSRHAG